MRVALLVFAVFSTLSGLGSGAAAQGLGPNIGGFLYENGHFSRLPVTYGINDDGVIFGGFGLQSISGGAVPIIQIPFSGALNDINDNGEGVGDAYINGIQEGFVGSASGYTGFSVPGSFRTLATGINDAGVIVGHYVKTQGDFATGYVLSSGAYKNIVVPGAFSTAPAAINDSGEIVGAAGIAGQQGFSGFILKDGVYSTFQANFFGEKESTAFVGINNLGQILGRTDDGFGFIFDDGVFSLINVPNSMVTAPTGINDSGQIVGYYTGDGAVPEPSAWILMMVGLGAIGGAMRSKRHLGYGSMRVAFARR